MTFYTYEYLREDGSPYYIGKGKGGRVMDSYPGHRPSTHGITVRFWPDEATAFAYEMYLIDFWGRKDNGTGILRNMTDGGENPPIQKWTNPDYRNRLVASHKRRWAQPEHRQRMSDAHKGQRTNLGKKFSAQACQRLSIAHQRQGAALRGREFGGGSVLFPFGWNIVEATCSQ